MRRALRFLFRNWPLKIGAVLLATVLYAGLVLSQNARVWPGPIAIEPRNQPAGAFLLDRLPAVSAIRYLAPVDVASRISSADFQAFVDLAGVAPQAGGAPVDVPVRVQALDRRIRIVGYEPSELSVRLDPVVERAVPVKVDQGQVPRDLVLQPPQLDATTVRARGASSLVSRVVAAVAPVTIDPNAINVNGAVDLIPVDDRGEAVAPLDLIPQQVHVRIEVSREQQSRIVPVVVRLTGSPPPGYASRSATVTPALVALTGESAALAAADSIETAVIDLQGRTGSTQVSVALVPPPGVEVRGPERVTVALEVVPITESRTFPVAVTLVGARADRGYSVAASEVLVALGGSASLLDGVVPERVSATIDVSNLDSGTHEVPVGFEAPAGLNLVSLSPARLQVVVSLPASPPGDRLHWERRAVLA